MLLKFALLLIFFLSLRVILLLSSKYWLLLFKIIFSELRLFELDELIWLNICFLLIAVLINFLFFSYFLLSKSLVLFVIILFFFFFILNLSMDISNGPISNSMNSASLPISIILLFNFCSTWVKSSPSNTSQKFLP